MIIRCFTLSILVLGRKADPMTSDWSQSTVIGTGEMGGSVLVPIGMKNLVVDHGQYFDDEGGRDLVIYTHGLYCEASELEPSLSVVGRADA